MVGRRGEGGDSVGEARIVGDAKVTADSWVSE